MWCPSRSHAAYRSSISITSALVVALIAWSGCAPRTNDPSTEVVEGLKMLKASAGDAEVIRAFAEHASAARVDSLIQLLDPETRRLTGDAAIREYLSSTILPFFRDFKMVDTYETIAGAAFPDGRTGIIHYTYIVNQAGQMKPISIALVDTDGGMRVVNVTVGECVDGRHPKSEGRCS